MIWKLGFEGMEEEECRRGEREGVGSAADTTENRTENGFLITPFT